MMSAWATPATATMTTNMAATPPAATTPIMSVIMGTPSATSALPVAGLVTIIIPATASFCSTMRAAVIRCASNIGAIGANGVIIGTASTEAVIVVAGATKNAGVVTTTTARPVRMTGVTYPMAVRAMAMMTGATAGVRIGAMTGVTAGEAQVTNGAAVAAVGQLSLPPPILMCPQTEAEAEGRIMATPMGVPTSAAGAGQMPTQFRRRSGGVPQYKRKPRPLNNCPSRAASRKIGRRAVSAYPRVAKNGQTEARWGKLRNCPVTSQLLHRTADAGAFTEAFFADYAGAARFAAWCRRLGYSPQ